MRFTALLVALTLGFTAAASMARDYDDHDRDRDYHYDEYRDFRDGIRHLRDHYDRVRDDADHYGANRRQKDTLHDIRDSIDRASGDVDSGRFDPVRIREKISRLHRDLHDLSEDLRHNDRDHHGFSIQIR